MCLSDPCRGWWAPGTHGGERKTTHGVRRTIWYRCEPGLRQHPCNVLPALTRDALGCRRHDGVVAAALRLPPVARALRAADPSPGRNRRPALRVSPCRSGLHSSKSASDAVAGRKMLERQPQVSPESKFEPGEAWCANSQLPLISTASCHLSTADRALLRCVGLSTFW